MNAQFFEILDETLNGFNIWSIAFRIILAALIGGCIGSERGRHGRAAGLRTHILVCLGATLTSMVGLYTAFELGFNNDPMRVGAQVISGIGFLGVGTILTRNKSHVTGLTTAAGLWTTASIGLAIGIGFYWAVIVAFVVVLVTMSILTKLEAERKAQGECSYYLEVNDIHRINDFHSLLKDIPTADLQIIAAKSKMPGNVGLELAIPGPYDNNIAMIESFKQLDYVVLVVPIAR